MTFGNARSWLRENLANYRCLINIAIVASAAHLGYGILNVSAIPPRVKALGLAAHIGTVYGAFMVVETLSRSPVGSLGDRIGRRPLYLAAALLGAGTSFLWAIAKAFWLILIIQGANGVVFATFYTSNIVAMGQAVGSEARTNAMRVFIFTFLGGSALGPLLGGYANQWTRSTATSFYLTSAVFVLVAILAYFLFPELEQEQKQEGAAKAFLSQIWLGIRSIPDFIALAFVIFCPVGLIIPIVKLFAMSELHMTEAQYGQFFVIGAVVLGLVSIVVFRLTEFLGNENSVKLGLAVSAGSMFVVALIHIYWFTILFAAATGLGFMVSLPAWLALVQDLAAPETRGTLMGALGMGQGLGIITGVVAGGYLYTYAPIDIIGLHLSSHYTPFLATAVGLTVAFVLSLIFIRRRVRQRIAAEGTGK